MRKTLTFIFVSLISFSSSFTYWFHSNQVGEYLSLSLYRPTVYRQLAPMLARSLTWFGVPANWAVVILMTVAAVAFYYALRALMLQFYQVNDLYVFSLWVLGLLLFWNSRLPSDYLTAFLFSLSLLFLAQDKLLSYCLLFPIICLNRETAFLLTVFYLFYDHDIHVGRDIAIMLYQVLVWFAVRLGLMWVFRHNGGVDAWVMPVHNFQVFLAHPWHSLLHITVAGVILYFVFRGWYSKQAFLQLAFCIFAPVLLIAYWLFGQAWEVRVMIEVYPVIALLMLPSLMTSKQMVPTDLGMVVLCDGGIPVND